MDDRTLTPRLAPVLAPLLACLATLALAGCKDVAADAKAAPEAGPETRRPVLVRAVHWEAMHAARSLVGTVRPRVESDLGFRVAGKVERRLVNVGDRVAAGQPVGTLDEVDLRLQIEQAEAERAAAAVAVTQADADLRRAGTLAGQGWTAASVLDRQRASTEEARSRLLRAERALTLAGNAASYAVLRADADGVVTATLIEPGQVVAAGQAAIRLAHTAEREAVVALPEALVGRARSGTARVSLWSVPGSDYRATLRELAPAADTMSRTYLAKFSLPEADAAVRLGMTATLTLSDADTERAARLPLAAIIDQGAGPCVWIVGADGALSLRPVRVAGYDGGDALIADGVAEGERVVRVGAHKLDTGAHVRVVDALQF